MLLFFDGASQTVFLYLFVLVVFIFVTSSYNSLSHGRVIVIESRPLLKDWRIWTLCLTYAIVFGFRYNYLQDWDNYRRTYENIAAGYTLASLDVEVGYYILNRVLSSCGLNYYSIFFIECFIWIFSICYLFKDHRKYLVFVIPIMYMMTTKLGLVASRQFLAMSFLYMAYKNLKVRKYLLAIFLCVIAVFIHKSCFVWIIPFFLFNWVKNVKAWYVFPIVIIFSLSAAFFHDYIYSFADGLTLFLSSYNVDIDYDSTKLSLSKYDGFSANLYQMIVGYFVNLMYLCLYFYYKKRGNIANDFLNNIIIIGLFGIVIMNVFGSHMILQRMAAYLSCFYYFGWGILVSFTFNRKYKSDLIVKVVVILILIYFTRGFVNSISSFDTSGVNPYLIYKL